MKNVKLSIILNNLNFYAYHGVLEQEKKIGGEYSVDIRLDIMNAENAIYNDELEGTINYADVYNLIKVAMQESSSLLEHIAGRILEKLFSKFPTIEFAEIKICKRNPPMGADCNGACIVLSGER